MILSPDLTHKALATAIIVVPGEIKTELLSITASATAFPRFALTRAKSERLESKSVLITLEGMEAPP